MTVLEIIGTVLLAAGALVFAVGTIGLLRLPDVYARLMAVTLVGTVGVVLVLLAAWCFEPGWASALKVAVVGALLPLTSSAGSSALARAAYLRGAPMDPVFDDLAEE